MRAVLWLALAACSPAPKPTLTLAAPSTSTQPPASTITLAPPRLDAALTSEDACARDGDCMVTNFLNCCTRCQRSAWVTSHAAFEKRTQICTVVDCAMMREDCPRVDANADDYRAACRSGLCQASKK